MRFYGMSFREVMEISPADAEDLFAAIEVIEAQETLRAFTIATYPKLQKSPRSKLHKEIYTRAFPRSLFPTKSISKEELLGKLGGKKVSGAVKR